MQLKLYVTAVRPERRTGDYEGGVRTTVHLTRKEALESIVEFVEMGADNPDEQDEPTGVTGNEEDALETRIAIAGEDGLMESWGIDYSYVNIEDGDIFEVGKRKYRVNITEVTDDV